ncbi:MAG: hypothetical protein R6V23_15055 [Bacteroidales bacterium]
MEKQETEEWNWLNSKFTENITQCFAKWSYCNEEPIMMYGVAKENNTYSHAINQYADFTLLSDHNPDNYRDIALS